MIKPLVIGKVNIEMPVILAPMAGVTDESYRLLCRELGCGMTVTEMVSAKAILYGNKGTNKLMEIADGERPSAVQLFGSDPDIMGDICARVSDGPYDMIDVNMGCPVPKVVKNGEGSALMRNPKLAAQIIRSMVASQPKPVTVKFRKGFNDEEVNAVEFAKYMEDAGASMIAVHGRTREQMYSGKADWDIIRQVKQAVSIPVIANGDVTGAESAIAILEQTGADGIMIGRAAQGYPWVFAEVAAALRGEPVPAPPTAKERADMIIRHSERMIRLKGERTAMREMRRHAAWYTAGMHGSASLRRALHDIETLDELRSWLTEWAL